MSVARAPRPGHGQSERPGALPQAGRRPEVAAVLRLQRSLGNRGTRALLRSPGGEATEFAPLSGASATGSLDAKSWKEKVLAAKQALADRKLDDATALYIELYQSG